MNRFEVIKSVTDVQKFSELIFDILKDMESAEQLLEFLKESLTEKQLQTIKSVAESKHYPLFLERLQ